MKQIQRFLAAIALLATLIGFSLQGVGSLTGTASNVYASAMSAPSVSAIAMHVHPMGPCPHPGGDDC